MPSLRPAFLLVLLLLALTACSQKAADEPAAIRSAMVSRPVPVESAYEIFSGEVRAHAEPVLAFRVGGKILRRHVDAGARVKQGELLAELDVSDLKLQSDAARARLAAAQADHALALQEQARAEEMLRRQLLSQSAFDARQASLDAAAAQLEQARAQLASSLNQQAYARLLAPEDGVIAQRLAEAGQVVSAGQGIFVLAAEGRREVAISLPEAGIEQFQLGQSAQVELWAHPGERWPGEIRELSPAADAQARTFSARVGFDAPGHIELGQSARVYLLKPTRPLLAVPLSAVGGEADEAFVWVLEPGSGRALRRPIEVFSWGERLASIGSGISADDWIVTGGVHLIRAGEVLHAVDQDNRAIKLDAAP